MTPSPMTSLLLILETTKALLTVLNLVLFVQCMTLVVGLSALVYFARNKGRRRRG